MRKKRRKLIYILGAGHSGSTLIDMILGSNSNVFSVGELAFYSHYLEKIPHKKLGTNADYVCTCGKVAGKCPFWSKVHKDFRNSRPIIKNRGHIDTYKIFLNILNPLEHFIRFNVNIGKNKQIFNHVCIEAKKIKPQLSYIVDSSKDPRRLYELLNDPLMRDVDLKVIYMVRDAFSYLNSFKKDTRNIKGLANRSIFMTIGEWVGVHTACRVMLRKYNPKFLTIKYLDFASDPFRVISDVYKFLEIGPTKSVSNILEEINKSKYHNLQGNVLRFHKVKSIVPDMSWKTGLTLAEKTIVSLFTFPFHFLWLADKKVRNIPVKNAKVI